MASDVVATFGDLLRRARRAAGLSQEELAARAGLSVRGISDLERGVNQTPRKDTLDMLADALGLSPEDRRAWELARRQFSDRPMSRQNTDRVASSQPAGGLPSRLTTFVGREREIASLQKLLVRPETRLVTVTGPGGIGKTSLAIQVATEVAGSYRDGARFVSLAPVRDPSLVATAIATGLGLQDRGAREPARALASYLAGKQTMLVLDNFEHVLDAAPLVVDVLLASPALTVLVTSRTPLRLEGEQEFPVAPLSVPPARRWASLERLTDHEAVALFVQRARQHRPEFRLTTDNADAIVEVCSRLDGLPLAIELAAARVKLLTPQTLLERLDKRLPLLTGGPRNLPVRQQTMRDTIAWSYDLLTEDQRRLFRQLSVFAGGWTLDAAEAVCDPDLNVLDGLGALIDHSLVQQVEQADGSSRFTMLETLREYGQELLAERRDVVRDRHAACFLAMAEAAAPHLDGANPVPLLNQLAADHSNLRAALTWLCETGDAQRGLAMVGHLREFWYIRGHLSEGRAQAAAILNLPGAAAPDQLRAMALATAAWLALWQGSADAIVHAEESLAIWRAAGDERHVPFLLIVVALAVDFFNRDFDESRRLNEQSLAVARVVGDTKSAARALSNLGNLANRRGNHDLALALVEESMAVSGAAGDMQAFALALGNLAAVSLARADYCRMGELLQERLRLYSDLDDKWGILRSLYLLVVPCVAHKQPELAVRLLWSVAALHEMTGITPSPNDEPYLERARSDLLEMIDEATFHALWEEARSLSVDEVVREALDARFSAPSG
jgi:predicted ATPase/transcriptional regulator with XRE-family HTH domain